MLCEFTFVPLWPNVIPISPIAFSWSISNVEYYLRFQFSCLQCSAISLTFFQRFMGCSRFRKVTEGLTRNEKSLRNKTHSFLYYSDRLRNRIAKNSNIVIYLMSNELNKYTGFGNLNRLLEANITELTKMSSSFAIDLTNMPDLKTE